MTSTPAIPPIEDNPPELAQYGIARVAADYFVIGGYRYSRLEDAVAEAKRRLATNGERP